MARKKISTNEAENLQCDISDNDINAAVKGIRSQLETAGIINPDKQSKTRANSVSSGYGVPLGASPKK